VDKPLLRAGNFLFDVKLPNGVTVHLSIAGETRAGEVVEAVAKIINLVYFMDFRLFVVDKLHNTRLIDDDEIIS
jgi:hypothetical protein